MVHTACPRCQGLMYRPADEDGDLACLCGFRLYLGQDPSEVYWKQLREALEIKTPPQPADRAKRRLKAQGWRKRIQQSA